MDRIRLDRIVGIEGFRAFFSRLGAEGDISFYLLNPYGDLIFSTEECLSDECKRNSRCLVKSQDAQSATFGVECRSGFVGYKIGISCGKERIGSLCLCKKTANPEQDKRFVATIADLAGFLFAEKLRHEVEAGEMAQELSNIYEELNFVYEVGKFLTGSIQIEGAVEVILRKSIRVLDGKRGILVSCDSTHERLRVSARAGVEDGLEIDEIITIEDKEMMDVLLKGRGVFLDNEKDREIRVSGKEGVRSFRLSPPILCTSFRGKDGKLLGLMFIWGRSDERPFLTHDLKLIEAVSAQAAVFIENAKHTEADREVFLMIARSLSFLIDSRSHYFKGHSGRISEFGVSVADELGLDHRMKEGIRLAGILHDVGMINVPVSILEKKGRLSLNEFQEVKKHPVISAGILEHIEPLRSVFEGIRHHHECFEGGGYPDGISGSSIPLISRIISVCDAFDAMTSPRPYRKVQGLSDALREVREGGGRQFDPIVANLFIVAFKKGKIIKA